MTELDKALARLVRLRDSLAWPPPERDLPIEFHITPFTPEEEAAMVKNLAAYVAKWGVRLGRK